MSRSKGTPHIDATGNVNMVDVGSKQVTSRRAVAEATLVLNEVAFERLTQGTLKKGDAWAVARVAAIQAAKKTSETIPLCHTIPLDDVAVRFEPDAKSWSVRIEVEARATARTGVEMEALVGVTAASLALYDMLKGMHRGALVREIRLLEKEGGKSGQWRHDR